MQVWPQCDRRGSWIAAEMGTCALSFFTWWFFIFSHLVLHSNKNTYSCNAIGQDGWYLGEITRLDQCTLQVFSWNRTCWKQCKPQGACSLINKHKECMPLSYCWSVNCSYTDLFIYLFIALLKTDIKNYDFYKTDIRKMLLYSHLWYVSNFRKTSNPIRGSQCCLTKKKRKFIMVPIP